MILNLPQRMSRSEQRLFRARHPQTDRQLTANIGSQATFHEGLLWVESSRPGLQIMPATDVFVQPHATSAKPGWEPPW